jgi:hypothetical protein
VIAIQTDHGTLWFKPASNLTAHEIGLYPLLVKAAPGLVLHPIAMDVERAWIVPPHGGTLLRHTLSGDELVDQLVQMMPHHALLQRSTASLVLAMLELGAPDMRPEVLSERFDDAMAMAEAMARDFSKPGDVAAMRRVRELRPRYMAQVEKLIVGPIPATFDHSDLQSTTS